MDLQDRLTDLEGRDWHRASAGTVRVAMLGLGWWTRERAIPAASAAPRCSPTVVVSGDRAKAAAFADDVPAVERGLTYDEFENGVATESYDAVYVGTPNATHLDFVSTAAAHGKHVLCEKPLEVSIKRARSLVETCGAAGVRLQVGNRLQTDPVTRRLRDVVRDGVVGEPVQLHGHFSHRLLDVVPDPDQWRLDPALVGRGTAVTDLGVYLINTARFVTDRDPVAVTATMASPSTAFESVPDERAAFTLTLEGAVQVAGALSQGAAASSRFGVVGTDGSLAVTGAFEPDAPREVTIATDGSTASVAIDPSDGMVAEFAYFADRILTDRPIEPDGRDGLVDVAVVDALYDAAATGERVPVSRPDSLSG